MISNNLPINTSTVAYDNNARNARGVVPKEMDSNPISVTSTRDSAEVAPSRADSFDVDALVKQIWSFTSGRLAQAEASGASDKQMNSMWQAAEKGVKTGFSEAKEALEDLGQLDDALKMKIDTAFGQIMDKLSERDLSNVSNVDSQPKSETLPAAMDRRIGVAQYERQTFSLDLKTNQGDTILIRSVAENKSTLDDQRFGSTSSTRWTTASSNGFELIIKGDLNDQERADLDALLAQVNEVANEFYTGNYDTAFSMASDLSIDGSSLKTMDLNLTEVKSQAVGVYAAMADDRPTLPKGLNALKEYADKLVDAQTNWQKRFDSSDSFIEAMKNHPVNDGSLTQRMMSLLG